MAIRRTIQTSKNVYEAHFAYTIDVFCVLSIDGKPLNYFEMIERMHPEYITSSSKIALMKKQEAFSDNLFEMKFINFIYKKDVLRKSYMKQIWKRVCELDNHSY